MKTVTVGNRQLYVRLASDGDVEAQHYGDNIWFTPTANWWQQLSPDSLRTIAALKERK